MNVFNGEGDADAQVSSIPRVPKLFLFLNVAVCVKFFMDLPLKELGYLFLLKIQKEMTKSLPSLTKT